MFGYPKTTEGALDECTFASRSASKATTRGRRITSTLILAILIALLLLSTQVGHASAKTLAPQDQISDLEQQMFSLINNDRASQGLPALNWDDTLATGARTHSDLMASSCGMQHQCPGEPDPGTRIANEGVSFASWAENIGYAWGHNDYAGDIQQIEQDMINEGPGGGHYDTIMSTSLQNVGVGVSIGANGYVWVTEDFVQP